jgi:hypothetical protein
MKDMFNTISLVGAIIIISAIFIFLTYGLVYAFSQGEETMVVKEKWVKYHGNDAKYLVSSNDEVYEISDSWIRWRWNSSDLYAYLQPGMTCEVEYQGFRFPFFSDYKNIIKAECIK